MNRGVEANLTLPDGRGIDYLDAGDPAGWPVFFQPGSPNTRIMGKLWHFAALAKGVRLISVSRPGYGGSTAITGRPRLSTVGRDLADLATLLGLDEYAVIGSSGGGPYAVAAAALDPLRVRALAVLAGAGPWTQLTGPSVEPEERAVLALGAGWDIDLRAVRAPTFLRYGGTDASCPVAYGRWYADRIAGAGLVVHPDDDHLAVGDTHRPEVLADLLGAWQRPRG